MVFISAVAIVVQGWWYIDGYDIQQFYKYYMKHIPRLSGVDHPVDYDMTSNYTNDILSWYPGYWKNQDLEPWHLISGIVIQGWWRTYRYGIPLFYECYMKHELYLTGLDHPLDHHMTSNYTKDMLSCYPGYEKQGDWIFLVNSGVVVEGWRCSYWYTTVLWVLYEAWTTCDRDGSPLIPPHVHTPHFRSAQLLPCVTKKKKGLSRVPYHWYSGARMMIPVWTYYPTVLWVLYEAWTTSGRLGSPNRPQRDLQIHFRHAQLLDWILEQRGWTMVLISSVVVVVQE